MLHETNRATRVPKGAIDYLLGKNRDRPDARVVKGDAELSLAIAENSPHKNKFACGYLCFEEPDLSEKSKREIMRKFEECLFPGFDKSRYNIVWVEHTDKGRLELNYFIPQIDLLTGKHLCPYFFNSSDFDRVNNLTRQINHEYDLTSPDEESKSRPLADVKRTPKNIKELKEKITAELLNIPILPNQNDVCEALENLGYKIAKRKSGQRAVSKRSISIENPLGGTRNVRLTGALFCSDEVRDDLETPAQIRYKKAVREYPQQLTNKAKKLAERYGANDGQKPRTNAYELVGLTQRASRNIDECKRVAAETNNLNFTVNRVLRKNESRRATSQRYSQAIEQGFDSESKQLLENQHGGISKTTERCAENKSDLDTQPVYDVQTRDDNEQSIQPLSNKPSF